jgi:phosphoribosylamine--glycine ligase
MGAYSPVSIATPALLAAVEAGVIEPTLRQMEKEGARFNGLLYAGLMIGRTGTPRVVEFNCRFGDPETQAILPLLEPGLLAAIQRVARNQAPSAVASRANTYAVTTVLAAKGYPDHPEKGALIEMPPVPGEGITIFHAGTTTTAGGSLAVSGGRVFGVTGTGGSFREAQDRSRQGAESINYPGRVFRRDIGWREVAR